LNEIKQKKFDKLQEELKDSSGLVKDEVLRKFDQIAIDLVKILNDPKSKDDLVLEEGDVLTIPKLKSEVRISGEVLFPTQIVYEDNMSLKDYIARAGGLTDNARKKRIYVLYPNGNAAKTSSFLFFRSYPKVAPGSEIIIPKEVEKERKKLTTAEVVGITAAFTSFAGVLLALINNLK